MVHKKMENHVFYFNDLLPQTRNTNNRYFVRNWSYYNNIHWKLYNNLKGLELMELGKNTDVLFNKISKLSYLPSALNTDFLIAVLLKIKTKIILIYSRFYS